MHDQLADGISVIDSQQICGFPGILIADPRLNGKFHMGKSRILFHTVKEFLKEGVQLIDLPQETGPSSAVSHLGHGTSEIKIDLMISVGRERPNSCKTILGVVPQNLRDDLDSAVILRQDLPDLLFLEGVRLGRRQEGGIIAVHAGEKPMMNLPEGIRGDPLHRCKV